MIIVEILQVFIPQQSLAGHLLNTDQAFHTSFRHMVLHRRDIVRRGWTAVPGFQLMAVVRWWVMTGGNHDAHIRPKLFDSERDHWRSRYPVAHDHLDLMLSEYARSGFGKQLPAKPAV